MNLKEQAYGRLLEIMDILREKCPWDRKQTFESLRTNTIEECFELCEAIDNRDYDNIREELGDLLLHIVFYAKIAEEEQRFGMKEVADGICDKLVYRHPHVFGNTDAADAEAVSKNWEQLKQKEKKSRHGVLAGVPGALPALIKAYRIGQKAAGVGFDWEKPEAVWAKVKEEIEEFEKETAAGDQNRMEEEFGDILFALTNAARLYGINPENALEKSNRKFIARFGYIEAQAEKSGKKVSDLTLDEMETYWQTAKKKEE